VSPEGVAEEGTDRATFKPTSGAMVAVLRFFLVHCTLWLSPILPRHQDLNFFKPLDATVERSSSTLNFWMNSMNFDELIQLQVLKLKA
jgi:hypothetical protein